MKARIYYHHTDCGGLVYYGRYLDILEEARTEFFSSIGLSIKELTEEGTLFVVSRQEIDYKLPAFYADTLDITVKVNKVSGVRIEFLQAINNQRGQTIAEAITTMVCVDKNLKPRPIPEEVNDKFTKTLTG